MHHLFLPFQKLIIHSLKTQKIYMLLCPCTICLYTAKVIQKQQEVFKDSKSFDCKASITGKLEGSNTKKESEIVVPLKYLSNFWRLLDIPLINSEINLFLRWSENYVFTSKAARDPDLDKDPAVAELITQQMQHLK